MYTRITSNMMMTKYRSTISTAMSDVSATGDSVTNERRYQNDSEDPVRATRAYQYRRETTRAENYSNNTSTVKSLLQTRESVVMDMSSMSTTAYTDILGAVTGTSSSDSRAAYAQQLRALQKSAVQSLNSSYGEQFIFGGTSTGKVPFGLEDDGTVTYRGVPVDGLSRTDAKRLTVLQGMDTAAMSGAETAGLAALIKARSDNMAKLDDFDSEVQYVDLGFGLEFEADGSIDSGSAFDISCNGISFLGYGTDAAGNSRNMVQLFGDLADALDAGTYDPDYVEKLSASLKAGKTDVTIELTRIGSDENFMDTNASRLSGVKTNLAAKQNDTEFIDEAEAITNFQAAQYAYKAALQIGNKILSQSFLDYMG